MVSLLAEYARRTPHGVRGLKYSSYLQVIAEVPSHPSRGAWIEMTVKGQFNGIYGSHPSRGAWIEIDFNVYYRPRKWSRTPHGVRGLKLLVRFWIACEPWSHPSRGAWIEIRKRISTGAAPYVAPLTGCVD